MRLPNPAGERDRVCTLHVPPHRFDAAHRSYRIRAALPSDEDGLRRMFESAEPEDIRLRFLHHVRRFPHEFIEPLTRADECRHFAFVALRDDAPAEIVGSAMMVADEQGRAAEFAIFVARAHTGQRLGSHLLHCLIREAQGHAIATVYGLIFADNAGMIDLARRYGFVIAPDPEEPGCVRGVLEVARFAGRLPSGPRDREGRTGAGP
jgi:RimJ/RimL family protein N-acetyltransferase